MKRYLRFLLRHRVPGLGGDRRSSPSFFVWFTATRLTIFTNFFDLYPPGHPYIQTYYQKYRKHVRHLEHAGHGDRGARTATIFAAIPRSIQKVDRITLDLLHNVPGVNGEQVMSITHPKLKTTLTSGSGIKVVPLIYPRLPRGQGGSRVPAAEGLHHRGRARLLRLARRQGDADHRRLLGGVLRPRRHVEEGPGDRQARGGGRQGEDLRLRPADPVRLLHARRWRRWATCSCATAIADDRSCCGSTSAPCRAS